MTAGAPGTPTQRVSTPPGRNPGEGAGPDMRGRTCYPEFGPSASFLGRISTPKPRSARSILLIPFFSYFPFFSSPPPAPHYSSTPALQHSSSISSQLKLSSLTIFALTNSILYTNL